MSKWYEKAIFYHIYPFGLLGVSKTNDGILCHRFNELMDWIPHLKTLGITAIYIGPLFESTMHGYDTKDYFKVDCRLGTNEEFIEFVDCCHNNNIKVVVDGVFNHTGKEFFAFEDIKYNRENARYRYWYKDVDFNGHAPSGEDFYFQGWNGIYDLAALNLYNEEVRNYLYDVVRFWIETFHIDGIRLDCADCLTFEFMQGLRYLVDSLKEDFWLMGELIHGDYSRWITPDKLNSSTNYELHKGLFSAHNDHNYFEVAHSIRRQFDPQWGLYKGMYLYNFVDNHDVDRIVNKLNNRNDVLNVYMLLFTLLGIPSIYYGSEFGVEGKKIGGNDDPLRPKLNIHELLDNNQDNPIYNEVQLLSHLKQNYECLTYGEYKELVLTNTTYAYARVLNNEIIYTVVNNSDDEQEMYIPVPFAKFKAIEQHTKEEIGIYERQLVYRLKPHSGAIFVLE